MTNRKKWLVVELIIYVFVAIFLLSLFLNVVVGGRGDSSNRWWNNWSLFGSEFAFNVDVGGKVRLADQIEVDQSAVEKLELNLVSEDIEVFIHDSDTVKIEVYSNADTHYPRISQQGKTIVVEQKKKTVGLNMTSGYVNVYVPADKVLDYTTNLVSGNLQGNINGVLEVNNVSGEIDVYGKLEEIDVNTVSGDVAISSEVFPQDGITVNGVSCDVSLRLPENNGFSVSASSISGDYENEFTGVSSSKKISEQYKNGGPKIKIDSVSGDLEILKNGK